MTQDMECVHISKNSEDLPESHGDQGVCKILF